MGGLREGERESRPSGSLNSFMGHSFQFPLASRLALPDSESAFGISQGPLMCTHMSLSHDQL